MNSHLFSNNCILSPAYITKNIRLYYSCYRHRIIDHKLTRLHNNQCISHFLANSLWYKCTFLVLDKSQTIIADCKTYKQIVLKLTQLGSSHELMSKYHLLASCYSDISYSSLIKSLNLLLSRPYMKSNLSKCYMQVDRKSIFEFLWFLAVDNILRCKSMNSCYWNM